jgi:hypothetical protein
VAKAQPWAWRLAAEWSCQAQRAGTSISSRTVPQAHCPAACTAEALLFLPISIPATLEGRI